MIGFDVFSAESGLVFYNNDTDFTGFHIFFHLHKCRSVIIRACVTVIDIKLAVIEPVIVSIPLQDHFLIADAV